MAKLAEWRNSRDSQVSRTALDDAMFTQLSLDPRTTFIREIGPGGHDGRTFNYELLIETVGGQNVRYLVKMRRGGNNKARFEGETQSLLAINSMLPDFAPVPIRHDVCPKVNYWRYFMVEQVLMHDMKALPIVPAPINWNFGQDTGWPGTFVSKLACMHQCAAPLFGRLQVPHCGFPCVTYMGMFQQDNTFTLDWAEFFTQRRLLPMLREVERECLQQDNDITRLIWQVVNGVIPKLISNEHLNHGRGVVPVLLHGNLGPSVTGIGSIPPRINTPTQIIWDPASSCGHHEFDLAAIWMWNGSDGFYPNIIADYLQICPCSEPANELYDRLRLYCLYYLLALYAIRRGGFAVRTRIYKFADHLKAKYCNGNSNPT